MYHFFLYTFCGLAAVCAIIYYFSREQNSKTEQENDPLFKRFQTNYLVIFVIAMGADWLQGPYVYALYEYYGFNKQEIAELFVVGFLSSMVFGTVVGGLADKYGRKKMCIAFSIFYSISCLTKLSRNYWVLMLGRLLSGVATSLLFSSFESWMVHEHFRRSFTAESLSGTFSLSIFCNGLVAIFSGLVASTVAEHFGYVAPFMVSLACLIVVMILVMSTWIENHGDSAILATQTFSNAINDMKSDKKIPILGFVQSLFEGAMYTFVFMWTPALSAQVKDALPFGIIFACFMVCIMIGSSLFRIFLRSYSVEEIVVAMLLLASCSLFVPTFSTDPYVLTGSFLLFELCCGIYFPAVGTLRGRILPETSRSTIMNFFRVPLNFLVVVVLLKVKHLANQTVFFLCGVWLALSFLLSIWLKSLLSQKAPPTSSDLLLHDNPNKESHVDA